MMRYLYPLCALALSACGPKNGTNTGAVAPTVGGTMADQWISPRKDVFIRAGFDTDPSVYIGRFIDPTQPDRDSAASELTCSSFVTPRVVGGGGVTTSEYFSVSSAVAGGLGVPPFFRSDGSAERDVLLRVEYTLTHKMQHEINDAAGFEACCLSAPDQCGAQFVGEFWEGTGQVYYSVGTRSELEARGISPEMTADLEMKGGRYWGAGVSFPNPVYFAFMPATNTHMVGTLPSGTCAEVQWDDVPPQSSQGQYFVGISREWESAQDARSDALRNAREQSVRWLAESIAYDDSSRRQYEGSALLRQRIEGGGSLSTAAEGVARFVKDTAWCTDEVATPGGTITKVRTAAFLPSASIEGAIGAALKATAPPSP